MFSLTTTARRLILARHLKDADPEERRSTIESLSELGEAAGVDLFVSALRDPEVSVRKAAAKALGILGDNRAVVPLIECLADPQLSGGWQAEVLLALESLEDPRALDACVRALTDPNIKVRRAAASALGNLGEPSAIPALIKAMRDEDDEVVRQAGFAMTKMGDSAVAPLIDILESESGKPQQAAADALGVIGDPRAVNALVAALQIKDSFLQIVVAKALSRFDDPRVVAPLVQALEDSTTAAFFYGVREEAEFALMKMGQRAIEPFLVALRDPNVRGRVLIAKLLAQVPDPRSFDPLVEILKDPDPELRKAALHSLMTIDPKKAAPVLGSMLSDPNSFVRRAASELLVKTGWEPPTSLEHARLAIGLGKFREAMSYGAEAIQFVLGCAQDEDASIRREVFRALGQSRDGRFIETLAAAAVAEHELDVQRTIVESLQGMGEDATDALVHSLEAGDWRMRRLSLKSLQVLGWEPASPLQQLLLALCTNNPEGAAVAGEFAPEQLMAAMNDDSDSEIQRAATIAFHSLRKPEIPDAGL